MTRSEILAAIRERAQELGHAPSFRELREHVKVNPRRVQKLFGSYAAAVQACGMERSKGKQPIELKKLFLEWAGIVRKLGKIPTIVEYEKHSEYSLRPLISRCLGWRRVPQAMLAYAESERLQGEWADVMEKIRETLPKEGAEDQTADGACFNSPRAAKFFAERPVYGPPMTPMALAHGPANEMGVVYLFGIMAWQLGFVVTRMQSDFPDCEAMRRITAQKWQKVRIEFEYESRNFLRHRHPASGCDVIVCWIHNWPECPLEVVELSKVKYCANCDGG